MQGCACPRPSGATTAALGPVSRWLAAPQLAGFAAFGAGACKLRGESGDVGTGPVTASLTPEGHLWVQQLCNEGGNDTSQAVSQQFKPAVALPQAHPSLPDMAPRVQGKQHGGAKKLRRKDRTLGVERLPMNMPLEAGEPLLPSVAPAIESAVASVAAVSHAHRKRFARLVLILLLAICLLLVAELRVRCHP